MWTTEFYHEDMVSKSSESYQNFKTEVEKEIKTLLESDPLVVEATVSMTDIKSVLVTSKRRKRSNKNVVAEFVAVSSIRLPTIDNMDEIQSSVNTSIQNADINLYNLIDEESLAFFKLSFEKPKIINIKTPSKEEITELIGINSNTLVCLKMGIFAFSPNRPCPKNRDFHGNSLHMRVLI